MAKEMKSDIVPVPKADLHDSRWINTPFAYTRLGANFSLLQQEIMLKVSDALQDHVKSFLDEKRYQRKDRPNPLFLEKPIPPVRIKMSELTISDSHYSRLEQVRKEILNLDIMVDSIDKDGQPVKMWMPVFGKVTIPVVGGGYVKTDKETGAVEGEFDKRRGYMDFTINPEVAQFAFDMAQGYVNHMKLIASYSRRQSTPRIYLMLRKAYSEHVNRYKNKSKSEVKVLKTVREVKDYTGVIEHMHKLDENNNAVDETRDKYPKFSRFCKEVLDKAREDLLRMASPELNQTDIIFDYAPIYKEGRHRGDPQFIEFKIMLSNLGKNRDVLLHRVSVENDIVKRLSARCSDFVYEDLKLLVQDIDAEDLVEFQQYALNEVWRVVEQRQPDDVAAYVMSMLHTWADAHHHKNDKSSDGRQLSLFSDQKEMELFDRHEMHVEPRQDMLRAGEGRDLWDRLLREYSGPASALLSKVKYLGIDDGVFSVAVTDAQRRQFNEIADKELYRAARLLLGMSETSFRPPIALRKK